MSNEKVQEALDALRELIDENIDQESDAAWERCDIIYLVLKRALDTQEDPNDPVVGNWIEPFRAASLRLKHLGEKTVPLTISRAKEMNEQDARGRSMPEGWKQESDRVFVRDDGIRLERQEPTWYISSPSNRINTPFIYDMTDDEALAWVDDNIGLGREINNG